MKGNTLIFTLLLIIYQAFLLGLLSVAPLVRSAIPNQPLLGIPPQDEDYFKISSSDMIKCKDGSKKFTKAQLNDDFCDCPDATDEPGTSACPGGKFYCQNSGHTPVMIFSSRVNDGICDCCDGSDEYDGQVKCPNTCWEAGKVARDKLRKKIAMYKEGVALRKQEVEQAKLAVAKDEAELLKLKDEEKILKGLVQQLKEHKEQIEEAEEKECLQKEKEEKERKEAEEKANRHNTEVEDESNQEKGLTDDNPENQDKTVESMDDDKVGVLDDSPRHQDMTMELVDPVAEAGIDSSKLERSTTTGEEQHASEEKDSVSAKSEDDPVVASETNDGTGSEVSHGQAAKVDSDISESTEGLSKEELGRLVASRWTGNTEKSEGLSSAKEMDHEDHGDMPQDTHDEEYDGYASETDDETGKYDDVDVEDDTDETYGIHDDAAPSYNPASDDDFDLPDATSPSNPSWLEKIQQTVRNILKAVNLFQTPVDITGASTSYVLPLIIQMFDMCAESQVICSFWLI
uniref:Uncharacterized protein MANES_16G035100 n=1 Tax=Rhizophora mucronata TaxID=61149 RepID=A0A2P2KRV5_RHIMU